MDLQDAGRMLAELGVPDLGAWLRAGRQSMETGPQWVLLQHLDRMPPQRTEFPDEDSLARYLVHQQLWSTGPAVPDDPAPARPWSVTRPAATAGPGLLWSSHLVTGSTCSAPDPTVLLVRDTSSWWDHLTSGAAVIRTVDPATGDQLATRFDNDLFALGPGPTPSLGRRPEPPIPLPRWARGVAPEARRSTPRQDLSVTVRAVPPPAGERDARFVVVRQSNVRLPTEGVLLQVWGVATP